MKFLKLLFSRIGIIGIAILLQLIWTANLILNFSSYSIKFNVLLNVLSVLIVLWIIRGEKHITYKLPWIILTLLFPLLGGITYVLVGANLYNGKLLKKINKNEEKMNKLLIQNPKVIEEIKENEVDKYGQINYIVNVGKYPVYKDNELEYFPSGESAYIKILEELKKAKKFIFLEFFIIEEGKMWNSILEILEKKVKEGVDVRVLYDDIGCIKTLPYNYNKILEKKGIKCEVFNRLKPVIAVVMNNRDHRKILDIDGKVAFTGGINLADEYINEKERFGYWKDTAIMIKGEAVWNLTVTFLKIWNAYRDEDNNDFEKFKYKSRKNSGNNGYVIPYGETPFDNELFGENIYLNIINQAKNYVYIYTPYLIIDSELMTALTLAKKRGVDVKIVTPSIPDKKIVFSLTRSYYQMLIEEGVEIYEFTPGFVHAKLFVSDDKTAVVGTLNLDYRSLYLHFECGTFIYGSDVIKDIKNDVKDTISKSHLVTKEESRPGFIKGTYQAILRIFSPLL